MKPSLRTSVQSGLKVPPNELVPVNPPTPPPRSKSRKLMSRGIKVPVEGCEKHSVGVQTEDSCVNVPDKTEVPVVPPPPEFSQGYDCGTTKRDVDIEAPPVVCANNLHVDDYDETGRQQQSKKRDNEEIRTLQKKVLCLRKKLAAERKEKQLFAKLLEQERRDSEADRGVHADGCSSIKVGSSSSAAESSVRYPSSSVGVASLSLNPCHSYIGPSLRRTTVASRKCPEEAENCWLDHRPDLIFMPKLGFDDVKGVKKLVLKQEDVTDPNILKYVLTTKEQSDTKVEFKQYKGDVLSTVCGGAQVVFYSCETLGFLTRTVPSSY